MTNTELRAWQACTGLSLRSAAKVLGVSESTYCAWLTGKGKAGQPIEISRRTALACAALAAGLTPWGEQKPKTESETPEKIALARKMRDDGGSASAIAAAVGVSRPSISRLFSGATWSDL